MLKGVKKLGPRCLNINVGSVTGHSNWVYILIRNTRQMCIPQPRDVKCAPLKGSSARQLWLFPQMKSSKIDANSEKRKRAKKCLIRQFLKWKVGRSCKDHLVSVNFFSCNHCYLDLSSAKRSLVCHFPACSGIFSCGWVISVTSVNLIKTFKVLPIGQKIIGLASLYFHWNLNRMSNAFSTEILTNVQCIEIVYVPKISGTIIIFKI